MLNAIVDRFILEDFYKSLTYYSPMKAPIDEQEFISSFRKFIKKDANLHIFNFSDRDIFINDLTQGRGDSKITRSLKSFTDPENFCSQLSNPKSCYFIDLSDRLEQSNLRSSRGHFLAFLDEYKPKYRELSLIGRTTKFLVRDHNTTNGFRGWSALTSFVVPFTDMVFIDNYIFDDPDLYSKNLTPLLCELDSSTPIKYNLLFISRENKNGVKPNEILNQLLQIRKKHNLKYLVGVYLAKKSLSEHDRGIFMNYLHIKSRDSFNYYNVDGSLRTHGTEIEFCPYTEAVNAINATETLVSIKRKFHLNNPDPYRFAGNKVNRLLS